MCCGNGLQVCTSHICTRAAVSRASLQIPRSSDLNHRASPPTIGRHQKDMAPCHAQKEERGTAADPPVHTEDTPIRLPDPNGRCCPKTQKQEQWEEGPAKTSSQTQALLMQIRYLAGVETWPAGILPGPTLKRIIVPVSSQAIIHGRLGSHLP